jgi:superfamily II DNA or RNA helicase
MGKSKLMRVTYYDPQAEVRLTTYADTLVCDANQNLLVAIRFGGYPESVKAMADAIYGGGSVDIDVFGKTRRFHALSKQYRRSVTHDDIYAEATLLIEDDQLAASNAEQEELEQPRRTFIFCEKNNPKALFDELDRKAFVPLIPQFQDYFLSELQERNILKQLQVVTLREKFDAWVLTSTQDDKPLIDVIDDGLKNGDITIPGSVDTGTFDDVSTVSQYLKVFGITVAERIKKLFVPLFDPATEPLSNEVLAVNEYMQSQTGYSLYDAQLAVAEAHKRRLDQAKVTLTIAECGSGKTKIGATALHAHQQGKHPGGKTFNVVLCPSQITDKWVREIEETLPNTFAGVITAPQEFDRFYQAYERDSKIAYAIISKEKARDGYMKQPSAVWSRRKKAFRCPDCGEIIMMTLTDDGSKYRVKADQFFFIRENDQNHKCEECGTPLWSALNPNRQSEWVKVGSYGFVHRHKAAEHLKGCKDPEAYDVITQIANSPSGYYHPAGAYRRISLSSYVKRKLRGRLDGVILDELHQYSNQSGQGDAMAEFVGAAKKAVGMTATLINGYSKGVFYLMFRMMPNLMLKDGREFRKPIEFNKEYGVVESVYELKQEEYNANRRTVKHKKKERQLPGVSPLVYTRFLMESAAFLSLMDMGKDLPEYEEIPVALNMNRDVAIEYRGIEGTLKEILKSRKDIAKKVLSAFMGLLTVYPDQPYDQEPIRNPLEPEEILVRASDESSHDELHEKDLKLLEIVREKIARRERVLIYTSWVRIDTQDKLKKLLANEGIRADILPVTVSPRKREKWVEQRVKSGVQVLITNPSLVETGMDLNDFTTLIYYNISYNLFNLRQSSRRSWRINQKAPRIEVYFFYYKETMQHRAMRLMANKLAVATIIEGNLSDEGLAAMSECSDITAQLAKELTLGIKNEVEDIAEAFKKMAILKPEGYTAPEPAIEVPVVAVREIPEPTVFQEPILYFTPPSMLPNTKKKTPAAIEGQLSLLDLLAS